MFEPECPLSPTKKHVWLSWGPEREITASDSFASVKKLFQTKMCKHCGGIRANTIIEASTR